MTGAAPAGVAWRGLVIWGLAALFFFYAWILRVAPSVMVEPLMRDFQVGGAVLGNLSAFYFYAYSGLQVPVGLALDRWGARRVLTFAVFTAALGAVASAYAPTIELAYAGRLLVGIGCAFSFVGGLVLAAAWFPPHRFALFAGLGMATGLAGGIAGQAPVAALVEADGWRHALVVIAVGGVALGAAIWLVVRDRPAGAIAGAIAGAAVATPARAESVWRDLWRAAKRRQTLLIAAFAGLMSAPMLVFGSLWGVPYAMERFGLGRTEAAFTMSFMLLGWVCGAPFWGWLSDRIGRRRAPMLAGAVLGLVAVTVAVYLPGLTLAGLRAAAFAAAFGGSVMSICYAAGREHNPGAAAGAALGFINMVSVLGGALLQPLVGWLLDLQWDGRLAAGARAYSIEAYRLALLILPACFVIGIAAALGIRETHCRPVGGPAAAGGARPPVPVAGA
jgi:MFS family permease